ncbi:hypothetical protein [Streptomyces lushanensis]|uniref:hypothetical protein n=1 Tax=Streptomyces lushanensis TaxID=1434255 RepID=UPI00082FD72D|nr:hypothetical protein [Streptomyces lushanensis]
MAEKTAAQLEKEIKGLRDDLRLKADSSSLVDLVRIADVKSAALKGGKDVLATQAWVEEQTKSKIWEEIKSPEAVGLVTALTIAKIEFSPLLSLEPVVEAFFKRKGLERNRFGVMWKVQAEELQRRAREIADAESRLTRMERGIARLQDLTTGAHTRIRTLERNVSRMDAAANTSRQQVRRMDSSPDLAGTTNRVTLLERRIGLLTAALS